MDEYNNDVLDVTHLELEQEMLLDELDEDLLEDMDSLSWL